MTGNHRIRSSFLMCSHSLSATSETALVFEGEVQAFERPYFHDERAAIHTLLRGTSHPLHMRAKACLPLSFVAPRLMYLCISSDWLLLDSHSRIHSSKTYVNRPYSPHTMKENNRNNVIAKKVNFFKRELLRLKRRMYV